MFSENFVYDSRDKNLELWLQKNLGKEVFSPDEDRLQKYFSSFKLTIESLNVPVIIIAGTNGKGEVALGLERLIVESGYNPFLWMSPHILSVRERFSCSGYPISHKEISDIFAKNYSLTNELSYYEFLFYCFCQWAVEKMKKTRLPVLILEVGLGGRLDATNFFDCDIAALVSIGRDHMDILGPSLSHVLKEKVAVSRKGKPLVSAVGQEFLIQELREYCTLNGVELTQLPTSKDETFKDLNQRVTLDVHGKFKELVGLKDEPPKLPLKLWGRPFEVTYKSTQFILVGSHNLDGLRHLAKWVNESRSVGTCGPVFDELWVGMSRKQGSELEQCLKLISLSPCLGDEVVFFEYEHPRATSLDDLRHAWDQVDQGRKVRFEKSWENTLQVNQGPKKVLVCGSYYFIGELLQKGPFSLFN